MFLQETKTKRGGKTYISYLVRESFRTANGPRGRTICNLTHLPKEVRDMVGQALRGQALVPLDRLEVNNIHSCGGCVVLEDAARRYGLAELLGPLTPRSAALVRAMIFGGLLTAPSLAPFYVEARTARLAMFCGLDPEKERFDAADLTAALRELDERWTQICGLVPHAPHTEGRAVILFRTCGEHEEMGAMGLDATGVPVPLMALETKPEVDIEGYLRHAGWHSKSVPPLLVLDEEMAELAHARGPKVLKGLKGQPWLIELGPETLGDLLRQLNQAQLAHELRAGGPVEARHHGERYVLMPGEGVRETQEGQVRMAGLRELASMTRGRPAEGSITSAAGHGGGQAWGVLRAVMTNVPPERLPAQSAMEWAARARAVRAAFAPVQIVMGRAGSGEGVLTWRNHRHLQFLTHWMRCRLHSEWSARGETRPVEDVLRDLQEVHRATLTVDGAVVRRLATHPSKAVSALLERLDMWGLFETPECGRK